MYKDVPFRMWPTDDVEAYVKGAKERYGWQLEDLERVYLIGADPFVLSAKHLIERIERMPRLRREVFVRVRLEGCSHRQVCEELGLSAKSVELHIARAVFDLSELSLACRHV